MLLEGSCHCQSVQYSVETRHPYPFNLCYCSICRKTGGAGGYAINLAADATTLKVKGEQFISIYQAIIRNDKTGESRQSPMERKFCKHCGSMLFAWHPKWPEHLHPFASSIDSELPIPPEKTHLMVASKANWVDIHWGDNDKSFDEYPDETIEEWHQRLKLEV